MLSKTAYSTFSNLNSYSILIIASYFTIKIKKMNSFAKHFLNAFKEMSIINGQSPSTTKACWASESMIAF